LFISSAQRNSQVKVEIASPIRCGFDEFSSRINPSACMDSITAKAC
jgi:hypothetical protein